MIIQHMLYNQNCLTIRDGPTFYKKEYNKSNKHLKKIPSNLSITQEATLPTSKLKTSFTSSKIDYYYYNDQASLSHHLQICNFQI